MKRHFSVSCNYFTLQLFIVVCTYIGTDLFNLNFFIYFCSDGVRSRTRTRSEAETLSSTSLITTLEGKDGVIALFFCAVLYRILLSLYVAVLFCNVLHLCCFEICLICVILPKLLASGKLLVTVICWVRFTNFDNFSDDFVENFFQWSELDEEDADVKDTVGKPEVNNPEHLDKGNEIKGAQDGARIPKVKVEGPGHARRDEGSKVEDNVKKSEVEAGNSKEIEDSITDGKESVPNLNSSTQEDVEYHMKHCECLCHTTPYYTVYTIPYHTIPYHTIPYHTIPYHTIPYRTIP